MSSRTRRNETSGVRLRWRRIGGVLGLALLGVVAPLMVALVFGGPSRPKPPLPPPMVRVVGDEVSFQAPIDQLRKPAGLVTWLSQIPQQHTTRHDRATLTYQVDRPQLEQAMGQALPAGGGTVPLPEHVTSSAISLPVIQQTYRNNCETAALSMLLAAAGVNASQVDLLHDLPTSAPVDQQQSSASALPVWGDPDEGFVGRPDGGNKGGGYGVYLGPIRAVAQKRGVSLTDLTNSAPDRIYASLLSGRPVMVWIGLSDGPYETWATRQGKQVVGNFGEHTVVLTGTNGANVTLNDPLTGQTDTWTNAHFELLWQRLGRRALGL